MGILYHRLQLKAAKNLSLGRSRVDWSRAYYLSMVGGAAVNFGGGYQTPIDRLSCPKSCPASKEHWQTASQFSLAKQKKCSLDCQAASVVVSPINSMAVGL